MISDALDQIVVPAANAADPNAGIRDETRNAVYRKRPSGAARLDGGREAGDFFFKYIPP